MVQSMTGYGKATGTFSNKKVTVEIRSLNSKGLDLHLKLPAALKAFEIPIRKRIGKSLDRGKVECYIAVESSEGKSNTTINSELAQAYYTELSALGNTLGENQSDLLKTIIQFPDVLQSASEEITKDDEAVVYKLVDDAVQQLQEFREQEGVSLKNDFLEAIENIQTLLLEVPKYEEVRIEKIRERMRKGLEKFNEEVDENRFQQELIYYLEKLDVSEEKTRLQNHLDYFRETIELNGANGKKLGFISQEIGREINTLGSKSYHAELQKVVVEMKDNLEKIKEQVLNTL